jgi:hypothetical protein
LRDNVNNKNRKKSADKSPLIAMTSRIYIFKLYVLPTTYPGQGKKRKTKIRNMDSKEHHE